MKMKSKTIIQLVGTAAVAGLTLYGLEGTGLMSTLQEHNLAVSNAAWIGKQSDFFYAAMVEGTYFLRALLDAGLPAMTATLAFKGLERILWRD